MKKHLTTIFKKDKDGNTTDEVRAHALYVSVSLDKAQEVSDALVTELGEESNNRKSAFVCDCIVSGVLEPVAQERAKHALEVARESLIPKDEDLSLWIDDDLIVLVSNLFSQLQQIEKALIGWPKIATIEFVSEDSQEYEEWKANG